MMSFPQILGTQKKKKKKNERRGKKIGGQQDPITSEIPSISSSDGPHPGLPCRQPLTAQLTHLICHSVPGGQDSTRTTFHRLFTTTAITNTTMPSIRLFPAPSNPRAIRRAALLPTRPRPSATPPSSSSSSKPQPQPPTPHLAARPYSSSAFQRGPAPPRLPPEQQAEFERLQRAVAGRLADPTPLPHEQQQQPSVSPASTLRHTTTPASSSSSAPATSTAPPQAAAAADDPTIGGVWRGAPPEFDGDKNPKTGEVGGPKTEPLRWGSAGDWSYNGRVTDF
jgi:hypothetical protein